MFFDTRANPLSYRVITFTAHKIKFPVTYLFTITKEIFPINFIFCAVSYTSVFPKIIVFAYDPFEINSEATVANTKNCNRTIPIKKIKLIK